MNNLENIKTEYENHHTAWENMNSTQGVGTRTLLPQALIALELLVDKANDEGIEVCVSKDPSATETRQYSEDFNEVSEYEDLVLIPEDKLEELTNIAIKKSVENLIEDCKADETRKLEVFILVNKIQMLKEHGNTEMPLRIAINHRVIKHDPRK